jgi:hypothetical protein
MPNTETSYEKSYTVAKKINGVSNEITANVLTFTSNHELENGETIRIVSDTGHIPDGLTNNQVYYAITTEYSDDEIKDSNMLAVKGWTIFKEYPTKEEAIKIAKRKNEENPDSNRKFKFPWQK